MTIIKSKEFLRKILIIISFLTVYAVIFCITDSHAYWVDSITFPNEESASLEIQIGEWDFDDGSDKSPKDPQPYDGFDLNEWVEEDNLNRIIPVGQMVKYQERLYIVVAENYNPLWHPLPGTPGSHWVSVPLDLDWEPNNNYRINSVVVREGRWFITKDNGSWFVDDPIDSKELWDSWWEIDPLSEDDFGYFPDSTIKDYTISDRSKVKYKRNS